MAKASLTVINLLRRTASTLGKSDAYQWGHMGACNCGFLAQHVTHLRKDDIHTRAMQGHGDWNEQLNDYCPTSGLPLDTVIDAMTGAGFDVDDLKHLERLSDGKILSRLPFAERHLKHNVKADVIKYLHTWAGMLEEQLIETVELNALDYHASQELHAREQADYSSGSR